jgi:hypothetical protein
MTEIFTTLRCQDDRQNSPGKTTSKKPKTKNKLAEERHGWRWLALGAIYIDPYNHASPSFHFIESLIPKPSFN